YLGLGYSTDLRPGWDLSADLGLMAPRGDLGGLRWGQGRAGGDDGLLRDLRLRPLLQVGASYAF
ncbi:MAG: hypothetical protein RLZZ524_2662, partial [Pseudomonadota bacterium]